MPDINLSNERKRDAVVKVESTRQRNYTRYIGPKGANAYTRRILKATIEHEYADMLQQAGDSPAALAQILIEQDADVDIETFGRFLWNISRVYVDQEQKVTFRIQQNEVVFDTAGEFKSRRPRKRDEANVDTDVPLSWTGRAIPKSKALRRYVFSSTLQIVHVNGLTYDFLYEMAEQLQQSQSLMLIGGGKKGTAPLIFRSGSTPYRGFLEGRVKDKAYMLLLHLSNTELKNPDEPEPAPAAEG